MMSKPKVLVIEDDIEMLENYSRMIRRFGYECILYSDSVQALQELHTILPDIILTDLRMPGIDGFEVLLSVKESYPDIPIVLITAYADIPTAVEAVKKGAYDVIAKPFTSDQLQIVLHRALNQKLLKEENRRLREQLKDATEPEFIAKSTAMNEVLKMVERVSSADANVLITGESGTGKEMIARLIHRKSPRAKRTFIPVDCAAIPENLLESELFGFEKGAFTGATSNKKGLFESANGGTIFLDEVTELPLSMQSKLLRVIQERKIRRLGSNDYISLDVRIISATNRDIRAAVKEGLFREDLYYRLNVINIHLPPLRQRKIDIPALAQHFLKRYSILYNKAVKGISAEVMELLERYHWPGNVRELQNLIERAVILCEKVKLTTKDLPRDFVSSPKDFPSNSVSSYKKAKESFERDYLKTLLESTSGNVTKAAQIAGLHRRTLHRLIKKYNLRTHQY